jgi:hypothetical protein
LENTMRHILHTLVALFSFAFVAACVEPPAAELNVDNAKRLMKGGAQVKNGLTVDTGGLTVTAGGLTVTAGSLIASSSTNKGALTTADAGTGSGTATATVASGAVCACQPPDGTALTGCSVTSTTLTVTAADEDLAVNYLCL